jgi:trafficking protein particle complex subunit 11
MSKHQAHIPALLVAFFHISSTDSHTTDEQLKVDINAIRTALSRSGYKTRFATILLSDKSILQAPELEERLSTIRRLTSLDSKTGLFFMPPMNSAAEIGTFVNSVMASTLQPLIVEYYRDLTKHARRKKAKGGPASLGSPSVATAGTATLSTVGWNARYEIKLAIFAEFRQEMDVAERHYSSSLDDLFSSEGIFETTPSWSPRWEEARLLADSLALRQIRCLLWSERTTAAVQCWLNFQNKLRDLINRRGKGSETSGWAAWEAKWAQIMAELNQLAGILPPTKQKAGESRPKSDSEVDEKQLVFATPERTAATTLERLPPWQNMHHAGYWYRRAVREARESQRRGQETPSNENDDSSLPPVSAIGHLTQSAVGEFDARDQERFSDIMKLELARDFVEAGLHSEAVSILLPLWEGSTWRGEDWHDLFTDLLFLLRESAREQGRTDIVVATTYELISVPASERDNATVAGRSLMDSMQQKPSTNEPIELRFNGNARLSPIAIAVAFEGKETHVGEAVGCQLLIQSKLRQNVGAIALSELVLQIGNTKRLHIVHDPVVKSGEESIDLAHISETSNGILEATANLSIGPDQRQAFNFTLTFREADVFAVQSASIFIESANFKIEHSLRDEDIIQSDSILVRKGDVLEKRLLPHTSTATIRVLPKPPKIRILLHGLRKQYYTDELVRLGVEIVNGELDQVSGEVMARSDAFLPLQWIEGDMSSIDESILDSELTPRSINDLEPTSAQKIVLAFKAPQDPTKATFTIDVNYTLLQDATTPLRKSLTLDVNFATPFEVKFSFGPLLYKEPWPSYFDRRLGSTSKNPGGIPQLWRLSTMIHSLATESIILKNIAPIVDAIVGDSAASIVNPEMSDTEPFAPGDIERTSFDILTQKFSLDDRHPTTVESTLEIKWSRDEQSPAITAKLPVPRLTLPVSEPRVLCTLDEDISYKGDEYDSWDAALQYHIENPSTHFLTFAVTMEATEEFAFSGPKYRTLSLAPLSRHKIEYRLALQDQVEDSVQNDRKELGRWIWPSLQVIDSYYQKTLRVHPGGDNVKFDDKQNIAVFIKDK